ncbi:MAG: Mur ligase family protein, partial [Gammaproteobacteria bacterium]|nr:Mur ligase family protein [Gammaproteobacteria bacterium]
TLCRLAKDTDYAVIEMGANHAGEIARLVDMAIPDVAVINNVASAHLEGFGDLNGVAKAKAEIYAGLKEDGIGIVNADMKFAGEWKQVLANKQRITFGLDAESDITAKDLQLNATSSHFMVEMEGVLHYINLPMPGLHNVANALAAIAATSALIIPVTSIVSGLQLMQGVPHRLQLRSGVRQSQLIDDSYNANPGSYQQALKTLSGFSGEHWLVLGDFGELGKESEHIHYQLGLDAKASGVKRLMTVGKETQYACKSFGEGAYHFENINALQQHLETELTKDVTCLIKGSRFMQLDKLADALTVEGEK